MPQTKTLYTLTLTDREGVRMLVLPDVPCNPRVVVLTTGACYLIDGVEPHQLPEEYPVLEETDQVFSRVGSAVHTQEGMAAAIYQEVRP